MTMRLVFLIGLVAAPIPGFAQESLTDTYREEAGRILGAALTDIEGWEKLEHLIGHRLSGSSQLDRAMEWKKNPVEHVRVRA